MEQKPVVFPKRVETNQVKVVNPIIETSPDISKEESYEAQKAIMVNEIFANSMNTENSSSDEHMRAVEFMRKKVEEEVANRNKNGYVKYPELAEKSPKSKEVIEREKKREEQMKLRDEMLSKNKRQIDEHQILTNEILNKQKPTKEVPIVKKEVIIKKEIKETNMSDKINNDSDLEKQNIIDEENRKLAIDNISQPNYNSPFDVIQLPSKGKFYKNKKANVRIGYLTTSDESILTSPNILQSGDFLSILINRKILEPDLHYNDLITGDRNAIMIWLRATAYGEMYPVTLFDEDDIPFDTEINLNELKTVELSVEPDSEGLFSFQLPLSKNIIKFKILTCGDDDEIEKLLAKDRKNGELINKSNKYRIDRMVVDVDGNKDKVFIRDFMDNIRIPDNKKFIEYLEKIDCGIDLNITVRTPGGGSIKTFLPLNLNFFWPDIKL